MTGPVQQAVVIVHSSAEQRPRRTLLTLIGTVLTPRGDDTTDCGSEPDRLSGFESSLYRARRTLFHGGDS